jgi:GntR family transcriptional regulator of vanillate catabolism
MANYRSATRQPSITALIRQKIIAGHFGSGEHLQEVPLSAELGVSRTPVREALVALGQEGLVTYRPNRGYVVREFTLSEILNAYEVRGTLEGLACRLLAEKGMDESTKRAIRTHLAEGDQILSPGELTDEGFVPWQNMNNAFHDAILSAADNGILRELVDRVSSMPMVSSRVVHWFDYDLIKRSHQAHHDIFDALGQRQGTRADALMREHIHHSTVMIRENYERLFKKPAASE